MMNIQRLIDILSIQSESRGQFRMFAYIIRTVKILKIPFYVKDGNIYITKGKASTYPTMVAHMDTVHKKVKDLTVVLVKECLTAINAETMAQTGIGGDDKVGVFLALEALRKFKNIKVAFFKDEEIGCVGSYKADMQFFDNSTFVLQCDRRGHEDVITSASGTPLCSIEFQDALRPIMARYGYKFTTGMMTDVMALKESGLKFSAINMSCGYYNPHCKDEFVSIGAVALCQLFVHHIISTLGTISYPHTAPKKNYYRSEGTGSRWKESNEDGYWFNGKWVKYSDAQKRNYPEWYKDKCWDFNKKIWITAKKGKGEGAHAGFFYARNKWDYTRGCYIPNAEEKLADTKDAMEILQKAAQDLVKDPKHDPMHINGSDYYENKYWDSSTGAWELKSDKARLDKINSGFHEDDGFHRKNKKEDEDIYCVDCRAEVATKNGLCEKCFDYYKNEYHIPDRTQRALPWD